MQMYQCCFCKNETLGHEFVAKEMMFGYGDPFDYVECPVCGSLQIKQVPSDLGRYYSEDYYSFATAPDPFLKRWLKKRRFRQAWGERSPIGRLLVSLFGSPPLASWLKPTGVTFEDAILDVGSGSGDLLLQMRDVGFLNLTGVDPYLQQDVELGPHVRVLKRELHEVQEQYSLVMFNHVLEHLLQPEEALTLASARIAKGKYVVVRIPLAGTYAWRTYGTDWVQLDAPRHLYIPTERGFRALAESIGYTVEQVLYDSTGFQFWGSEQYVKGIPLMDAQSHARNPKVSIFSTVEIKAFEEKANALNQAKDGDSACFFLRLH